MLAFTEIHIIFFISAIKNEINKTKNDIKLSTQGFLLGMFQLFRTDGYI